MTTKNLEATKQKSQGRNPLILIGGLTILVAAFAFLLLSARLYRGQQAPANL